jgi:hypothetical protein
MYVRRLAIVALSLASVTLTPPAVRADPAPAGVWVDLSDALIVTLAGDVGRRTSEGIAVGELSRRVRAQTGVAHVRSIHGRWPSEGTSVIAVGLRSKASDWAGPLAARLTQGPGTEAAEGYTIVTDSKLRAVAVAGNDERGVVFGVGRLLRELRMSPGRVALPEGFHETSRPRVPLRGHQLGYRPKTNSYDAWDIDQWNRYLHDLAFFGANAVELVPPRTDDDADSPHFPLPPLRMMRLMSDACDTIGLDVWVWFPVMDPVDRDSSKTEPLLKEWDAVFRNLSRLDAVFVPGGDPGSIPPKPLFDFMKKATEVLHKSHPKAQMWVSPQGFNAAGMEEFLGLMRQEPEWLTGIVFGPQVRTPLNELRKAIPSRYPIRGYPDITHSRQCQHPVPDWDLAYAVTEGREGINPRPLDQARIFKSYLDDTVGFITYSEGCNDDVNKAVWSALGWDPDADVVEVLRQYARLYLGGNVSEPFAQALLALERNWHGPLLTNTGVETTLHQLQDMERDATPKLRQNWRFQQALYRAYYDAYLRDRLIQETALQVRAYETLRAAPHLGSDLAMRRASATLQECLTEPVGLDRRARVFELGEALFQSVRMQLSVTKYRAIAAERGANLDTIDTPLNDRLWLEGQFTQVRALPTEPERVRALLALVNRTDPGPDGFYDALGDPAQSRHLVRDPSTTADPMFVRAPFQGFALRADWPVAWRRYAQTFYDAPLRMAYDGLDPKARYRVRVVYSGDSPRARMRLEADGAEVHPYLAKPNPVKPVEFPIPAPATADGRLTLTFTQEPGRGGNGRGCQVAEVWLLPEAP